MGALHDVELLGLSEAERAALADAEEEGDWTNDEPAQPPAGQAQGEDADEVEDAEAASQPQASDTRPAPDEPPHPDFEPVYIAPPVEGYAELMAELAKRQADLAKRYEDGDFDLAEYQAQLRATTEQEWALRERQLKASLASEQRSQQMAQRWQWEQERFFSQTNNKAYRDDPVIGPAFAAAVQILAADANNDARPMSWFLDEADRMTRARFRLPGEAGDADRRPTQRGRQTGKVPPTLGGLPAATIPEVSGDEFSRLDRLEGMELETALARLSAAEADRYLLARGG